MNINKAVQENKGRKEYTAHTYSTIQKIKFPDSTHSSLHMKKAYLDKKINSHNNTINKYKELVDEFSTGHSENKNKKTKLKKVVSKLESEYFSSANPKYEDKLKFKNRNKNNSR